MAARPARVKNRHIEQLFSKEAVRKVPSRVVGCYSVRRILPPTDPWPGNMRLMRTSSSRFWPCVVQLKSDVSTQIELAGNLEAKLSKVASLSSVLLTFEGYLDFVRPADPEIALAQCASQGRPLNGTKRPHDHARGGREGKEQGSNGHPSSQFNDSIKRVASHSEIGGKGGGRPKMRRRYHLSPSQEDKARTIWGQISTGLGKTCCLQLGFMVPSSCPKLPPDIATRFVLALLWSLKKFRLC